MSKAPTQFWQTRQLCWSRRHALNWEHPTKTAQVSQGNHITHRPPGFNYKMESRHLLSLVKFANNLSCFDTTWEDTVYVKITDNAYSLTLRNLGEKLICLWQHFALRFLVLLKCKKSLWNIEVKYIFQNSKMLMYILPPHKTVGSCIAFPRASQ